MYDPEAFSGAYWSRYHMLHSFVCFCSKLTLSTAPDDIWQ